MAAGSNNSRNNRSGASKPYDVSNSFVKRVASRVTELLPPSPSWLSRWISPASVSNTTAFLNHTYGLTSTVTSRLPATSRTDLNVVVSDDNPIPAKKQKISRYNSPVNQNKFSRSDIYGPDDMSPIAVREPLPGPSTARPELVASTPATHGQKQSSAKVNGDDCSDSSESTSGCSSLVPQAQSTTRSLGGSRYGHIMSSGSNMDYLGNRRPSFSTTTFASPLRSMRTRVGSSPFYTGRTMYGGSAQTYLSSLHAHPMPGRLGVSPAVPAAAQQALPLSSTARRILDALEHFSTPVMDAKRMPVGSKRKLESGSQRYTELSVPSTPDLLRVKRRERLQQSTSAVRQTVALAQPSPPSPVEYSIRKEEDDEQNKKKQSYKIKTKDKLNDDVLVEVKLPSVSLPLNNLPKIDIAIPPAPAVHCPASSSNQSPNNSDSKFVFSTPTSVPHSGIKATFTLVSSPSFTFSPPISEITCARKLPVNANFKSDLAKSSESPHTRTLDTATPNDQKSNVKLAFPVKNDSAKRKIEESDHESKQESSPSINEALSTLKKISRMSKCNTCDATTDKPDMLCSSCLKAQKKTDNSVNRMTTSECSPSKSITPSNSLRTISTSKALPSSDFISHAKSLNVKNNDVIKSTKTSGFGDLYLKPSGTWECATCMIHNKGAAIKCIACESPKPVAKKVCPEQSNTPLVTAPVAPLSSSGFGDKFKKPSGSWECQTCCVTNKVDDLSCIACQTPKAGSNKPGDSKTDIKAMSVKTENGFGDTFKKPAGSWECNVCMVSNDAAKVKCIACETVKPGATLPKESPASLTTKFSFGIPSTASSKTLSSSSFSFGNTNTSSSTLVTGPTFSFGIPKVSDAQQVENQQAPVLTSSISVTSTSQGPIFSFGMSNSTKSENDTHSSAENSSLKTEIQFGSTSKVNTNSKSNPSTPETFKVTSPESVKEVKADNMKRKASVSEHSPSNTATSKNLVTSAFSMKNEKPNPEIVKANTGSPMFTFGADSASKNAPDDKASPNLPANPAFLFGSRGGSSVASSTINTMTASTASGVFKFGDTKTVCSGGNLAVSSATQPSISLPKSNNLFTFGSSTEKKDTSFGSSEKEVSVTSTVKVQVTESKPAFGSFGSMPNTTQTFGNAKNTFTSSNNFGGKEQPPNPFASPSSNVFGSVDTTSASSVGFTSTNTFGAVVQENKPSALFTFGSTTPKETAPGGFIFNPAPTEKNSEPTLGFNVSQSSTPGPSLGFSSAAPSTSFNFEPKFGVTSTQFAPRESSSSIFGTQSSQSTTFGEQANPNPVFAFGSQTAQPPANPVFEFGSNQQMATAAAPAPTFMFGASSNPNPNPTPAPAPAFDPNMKPTFNFSGGSTPVFSAIPTVINSASAVQPVNPQRKIRKAVRRTNISSVRQS